MKYIITITIILLVIGTGLTINSLKKGKKIDNIKEFEYYYTNGTAYNSDVLYFIKCNDKCSVTIKKTGISRENAKTIELPKEKIKNIENILNKYDVGKWNGFNKNDNSALDGDSFTLNIYLNDNSSINASGYMKWPKNYNKVKKELDDFFEELSNINLMELYDIKINN